MRVTWPTSANISTNKRRVFVGLSGGVDSAVSAALLQEQGYEVTGVFIRIALEGYPCTAGEDKLDAMRAAAHLKIPFLSVDLSQEYKKRVFELSVAEFAKGRTPNPDVLCNREIKFGLFFDWCISRGAEYVATGHYARVQQGVPLRRDKHDPNSSGEHPAALLSGLDEDKDQSYFLALVPEEVLQKTLFPVGHLRKQEVRKLAEKFGLPNAARKDSQGLCFLGPVSLQDMLAQELHPVPGAVVDQEGNIIGSHDGAALYTLGQRHGFLIQAGEPHYVVAKDTTANTITVSPDKFPRTAVKTRVTLADANWIGAAADGPCVARYRYRQTLIPAEKKGNEVILHEPHYVPEGQLLALYQQDRCLGGGIIQKSTVQ